MTFDSARRLERLKSKLKEGEKKMRRESLKRLCEDCDNEKVKIRGRRVVSEERCSSESRVWDSGVMKF